MPTPRICALGALLVALATGCTTVATSNTSRTATEQLLISNAVDQSLDKIDFKPFRGQRVYVHQESLECVDKPYVLSSIRHRLFHSGASIVKTADEADIVVEPRSGAIGTDTVDQFIGIPEIGIPGMPLTIPEMQFVKRQRQSATAKIGLVAFTPEDGRNIGQGGTSLAQSGDSNWFVLGMGPLQTGSVKAEVRRELPRRSPNAEPLPTQVAFNRGTRGLAAPPTRQEVPRGLFDEDPNRVRLTGDESASAPPRRGSTPVSTLPIPEGR